MLGEAELWALQAGTCLDELQAKIGAWPHAPAYMATNVMWAHAGRAKTSLHPPHPPTA